MSVTIYSDDVFLAHRMDGHPESPERLAAIVRRLRDLDQSGITWRPAAPPVPEATLALVHPPAYTARLREACAAGGGWLDEDTYCTPDSYAVALRAVGTAVACAVGVASGGPPALALIRPPGHHATATRAMGFCLFNNVAVAARAVQAGGLAPRVAIIDIDVHHGNGTQEIFYADPSVLYCSIHEFPFYPGTGAAGQTGSGDGRGTTVNVPLPAGTARVAWLWAFDERIAPAVTAFGPDLILVSAGFDAHTRDPLADFDLTTRVYGEIAERIGGLAQASACGASAWCLEGGYAPQAAADSCAAIVEVLRGGVPAPPAGDAARGAR